MPFRLATASKMSANDWLSAAMPASSWLFCPAVTLWSCATWWGPKACHRWQWLLLMHSMPHRAKSFCVTTTRVPWHASVAIPSGQLTWNAFSNVALFCPNLTHGATRLAWIRPTHTTCQKFAKLHTRSSQASTLKPKNMSSPGCTGSLMSQIQ